MKKLVGVVTACVSLLLMPNVVLAVVTLDNPADNFYFWATENAWFSGSAQAGGGGPAPDSVRAGFQDLEIPPNWIQSTVKPVSNGTFAFSLTVTSSFNGQCRAVAVERYGTSEGPDSNSNDGEIHNQ
jgi:hypothetical protein